MAFRTIVINNRCKLEYSLNYLICRKETTNTKILIDEIKTIIINSTQVVITSCLLAECINKKIKIIFTDSKHNPIGETVGYYNNYYSYRKIKEQIALNCNTKNKLWSYSELKSECYICPDILSCLNLQCRRYALVDKQDCYCHRATYKPKSNHRTSPM